MINKFSLTAVGVIAFAVSLCSCSRSSELIETVPASVHGVIAVNFDALGSACGFGVSNGSISLPAGVTLSEKERTLIEKNLPMLREAVDISDVIISTADGKTGFATFALKDKEILRRVLRQNDASALGDIDGFEAYGAGDDIIVYLGDRQGWAIAGSKSYTPRSILTAAEKVNFKKDYPAIASFIGGNKMISVAAKGSALNMSIDRWVCAGIRSEKNDIVITNRCVDRDGNVISNSLLQNLDPAVLKYLPGNAAVVFAAGLTKDINWNTIVLLGTLAGGFETGGMLEAIVPFISKTDGTIGFAAVPNNESSWRAPSLTNWDFLLAAQMNDADGADAVKAVRHYLKAFLSVTDTETGFIAGGVQGLTIRVTSAKGIFSISKGNISHDSGWKKYAGERMLVAAEVPQSVVLRDYGIKIKSVTGETDSETTISLPGSSVPFLQAVLEQINR